MNFMRALAASILAACCFAQQQHLGPNVEFCCKHLNSLVDWAVKIRAEACFHKFPVLSPVSREFRN
jgi:hypothetical protein